MISILYLEDEDNIRDVTSEYLKMNHYQVDQARHAKEAFDLLSVHQYDLAILDIMVPYGSGLDVLKALSPKTASIMLTALDDEKTQLEAFNLTCDDFMIKPFSPLILIKRIEAILRRTSTPPKLENIVVRSKDYQVYYKQKSIGLTVSEFLIFEAMYSNVNQVFTREMILSIIAPNDYMVSDRVVDAHIKNLRKKLPFPMIKTVVGLGYSCQEINDENIS